jgi:hypothetical protein
VAAVVERVHSKTLLIKTLEQGPQVKVLMAAVVLLTQVPQLVAVVVAAELVLLVVMQ